MVKRLRKLGKLRDPERRRPDRRVASSDAIRPIDAGQTTAAGYSPERPSSARKAAPYVGVAFVLALIVLTIGLIPAYSVPWYRTSILLAEYGQQFTLVGALGLFATGIFLLMVVFGG